MFLLTGLLLMNFVWICDNDVKIFTQNLVRIENNDSNKTFDYNFIQWSELLFQYAFALYDQRP